ncbi:hypothetical protein [Exiguobacterium artemiae]
MAQQLNNWLIPIVAAGLLLISALSVEELYRASTKSVSERLEREMTMLDANIRSIYLAYPEDEQERTRAIKRLKNQQLADMARDEYDAAIQSLATKNVAIQPLALTAQQKRRDATIETNTGDDVYEQRPVRSRHVDSGSK